MQNSGNRVFKRLLPVGLPGSYDIPIAGWVRALGVNMLNQRIVVWAEVDNADTETAIHRFHVIATGDRVPSNSDYIGSAFLSPYYWHVYKDKMELRPQ